MNLSICRPAVLYARHTHVDSFRRRGLAIAQRQNRGYVQVMCQAECPPSVSQTVHFVSLRFLFPPDSLIDVPHAAHSSWCFRYGKSIASWTQPPERSVLLCFFPTAISSMPALPPCERYLFTVRCSPKMRVHHRYVLVMLYGMMQYTSIVCENCRIPPYRR